MTPMTTFFGDDILRLLPNAQPQGRYGRAFGFGSAKPTIRPLFGRGLRFGDDIFVGTNGLWPAPSVRPVGGDPGGMGQSIYGGVMGPGLWYWPLSFGRKRRSRKTIRSKGRRKYHRSRKARR
jgi:hypothetical protein